jgi:hypothetical protein
MRALVVYESMYGNTRMIADAIAEGLRESCEAEVARVGELELAPELLDGVDLLVVGGPTHVWSMSRGRTRSSAVQAAQKPGSDLHVEPGVDGSGVREWLNTLERRHGLAAAAFDTRMPGPAILTGRASAAIGRRLRRNGCRLVVAPESFRVSRRSELLPGEPARARDWGERLAAAARKA